jgi:hypothetical protein
MMLVKVHSATPTMCVVSAGSAAIMAACLVAHESQPAYRAATYFVAGTRVAAPHLAATLPSADEVVAACLAAIPVGLDQVALLDDDRGGLHRLTHTV